MKILAVCAGLLAVFFIISCGPAIEPAAGSKLRGTWKSNDPSIYSGSLTISISNNKSSNDRITITGYDENQSKKYEDWDEKKHPFKGFTKGAALKCRWELEEDKLEGILYITDRGKEQEGLPFVYYEGDRWHDSTSSTGYRTDKYLCFIFGGREEILDNEYNHHIKEPPPDNTP
jgi:hypothetical protein